MVNSFARVTGGVDRHCLELANGLRGRGHQVEFLSTQSPENLEGSGAFVELTVSSATRDELPPSARVKAAAGALWNRQAAAGMGEIVRSFRPDLVHAHRLYPQLSVAPLLVARRHRVPIVQTLHDYGLMSASALDESGGRLDRQESRLQYRLLNDATFPVRRFLHRFLTDRSVAISEFVAAAYARRGVRSTVIPNFTEHRTDASDSSTDRHGILFAGRLEKSKGVDDAIGLARARSEVHLSIAGDGLMRRSVEEAAARLPNLRYLGQVGLDRMRAEVRSARLVIVPSRWQEPGGLVALESMAAGTPVVAYDVGGLGEYVSRSGGGLTVSPDLDALLAGCDRLMSDPETWSAYSKRGLASARDEHSIDGYLLRLEELYRSATAGRLQRS